MLIHNVIKLLVLVHNVHKLFALVQNVHELLVLIHHVHELLVLVHKVYELLVLLLLVHKLEVLLGFGKQRSEVGVTVLALAGATVVVVRCGGGIKGEVVDLVGSGVVIKGGVYYI